jgi:dTDP-4-amino-4,6-dideoxygalactose transaminase
MQFINFNYQKKIQKKIFSELRSNFKKNDFILGDKVKLFEKNFAKFSKKKYAIGVSSGTDALFLALKTLSLKKNDEVIVPAHTFIATALSVVYANIKIKLCDVSPETWLMDEEKLEKIITKNTKVIIPVHLYGYGSNINRIKKIIGKRKIKIIEDASQAHGLNHFCKNVFKGDIIIFSLYPAKNLGANGDAGIIITNQKKYYSKILRLRNWGSIKKYEHDEIGYNMRMDTIQATILIEKLKSLKKWTIERIKIAKRYNKAFEKIKNIEVQNPNSKNHVYHLFVIKTNLRDKLKNFLEQNSIPTIIHYPKAIHQHKAFSKYDFYNKNYPISELLAKNIISLPLYPNMKLHPQNFIIKKIEKFFAENE